MTVTLERLESCAIPYFTKRLFLLCMSKDKWLQDYTLGNVSLKDSRLKVLRLKKADTDGLKKADSDLKLDNCVFVHTARLSCGIDRIDHVAISVDNTETWLLLAQWCHW